MAKKSISIITTDITNSAGTERVLASVSNFLADSYKIKIYSMATKSGPPFFTVDNRVEIHHMGLLGYHGNKGVLSKCYKKISNTLRIPFLLRNIDSDLIIGMSKNINIYLVLFRFFLKNNPKIIGCEHFAANRPMGRIITIIRNLSYKKLNRLVVLTKHDYDYYKKHGVSLSLIPNFIPTEIENASANITYDSNTKVLLAVARHTEQKRIDLLLSIWAKIADNNNNWKLVIVGDGELLERNIELSKILGIEKKTEFIRPQSDIYNYYKRASIFLLTSDYEALPMVLLEASAFGLPCISFDCDTGPRDIITHNYDGFLIKPGNLGDYTNFLQILIDDEKKRLQFSINARENSMNFTLRKISPLWLEMLKDIEV
ncbi:glycosyltransferase family 4 protein [Citrobacter freundii complex sp. 2023EL-00966]|uniref:glycosyltransferase family 4 protein n=2 Tax=Citrobacter TaxID=544 RepID=UPI002894D06D|nr:glycosyltransferase family 4 protein [Citrobacter freundii complex sp. 2023EL-00966]MDT3754980.1 glycosyltransferase family 4 protein [Citrobacter freundii complex sp. 2023EL-00966]